MVTQLQLCNDDLKHCKGNICVVTELSIGSMLRGSLWRESSLHPPSKISEMSDRILRQRHLNKPYTLAAPEVNEQAAINGPPSPTTSESNPKSKRKRVTKIHSPVPEHSQVNAPLPQIVQVPSTFILPPPSTKPAALCPRSSAIGRQ